MNFTKVSYVGFSSLICYENEYESVIKQFYEEFNRYYSFEKYSDKTSENAKSDVLIYIKDFINDDDADFSKSENVVIHSSHSKNKKYLIDGSVWTQNDAKIDAVKKESENKIFYQVIATGVKILLDKEKSEVYLSGKKEFLYDMLSYIFESLTSLSIENRGGIQFHAACLEMKNKGIIITGKSGGGKTSFLFDALKKGAKFHSNDRCATFIENDKLKSYSIPIPVNVPIKAMRADDSWKNTEIVKNAEDNTKIRFKVCELDKIFKENIIEATEVSLIIVVNYIKDGEEKITLLDNKAIFDCVEILTPFDENHPKWLPFCSLPEQKKINESMKKIGNIVKIYEISGNNPFKTFEEKILNDTKN